MRLVRVRPRYCEESADVNTRKNQQKHGVSGQKRVHSTIARTSRPSKQNAPAAKYNTKSIHPTSKTLAHARSRQWHRRLRAEGEAKVSRGGRRESFPFVAPAHVPTRLAWPGSVRPIAHANLPFPSISFLFKPSI